MNYVIQLVLIIAVIVLALFMLLLWLRTRPHKVVDDKGDKLQSDAVPCFQFKGLDESLTARVLEAINRMGAVGDNAEENYQISLKALQPDSKTVVQAIGEELKVVPTSRYLDRWSLIQLLAELRDPASLPLLDNILSKQMPAEIFKDPHSRSSLRQETINLTTAVEAITRIASEGNTNALESLLKHAAHESLSVRRACVQGYSAHGGKDARKSLLEALPQRDHYLLDIRKTDIEKVPQIRVVASEIPTKRTKTVTDVPRVPPRRDE
jgi:hypothetical protein